MPDKHVQQHGSSGWLQQELHEGKDVLSKRAADSSTSGSIPGLQGLQHRSATAKPDQAGERLEAAPPGKSRAQIASQEAEHVRRQGNEAFSKGQYAKSAELYGQVTPLRKAGPV